MKNVIVLFTGYQIGYKLIKRYLFLIVCLILGISCNQVLRSGRLIDLTQFSDSDLDSMKVALVKKEMYRETTKYLNGILRENSYVYNGKATRLTIYDSLGNLIEEKCYDTTGNVTLRSAKEYTYDESGNILIRFCETTGFKKDSSSNTYTLDYIRRSFDNMAYENGKLVSKVTSHLKDNSHDTSSIYKEFFRYDSQGNLVEEKSYWSNRSNYRKSIYLYDSNNRKIKEMVLDSAGILQDNMTIVYNEQGNIIEERYDSGDEVETFKYQYVYDKDGKVLRQTEISEDAKISTINYFDSTGTLVKCYVYTGEKLYSITIYTYNSDGDKIDEFNLNVCGCGYNHKELKLYKYGGGQLIEAIRLGSSIH